MEEKVEEIAYKITGWMKSNRMGDLQNEPCLWSIYELSSITSKPVKNAATNCDNFTIEGLDESAKHLLECMSYSTHVKYFAVRLRKKQGDPGVMNNYENPYYQTPHNYKTSSIGNLPKASASDNTMMQMMIGLINGMHEERRAQREENNAILTELKLQNKEHEYRFKEYKLKQQIGRIEEEKEALANSEKSFFKEMIGELMPEIKTVIASIGSKQIPYKENDYQQEEEQEEGEPAKDNDNQQILNNALNLLATKVEHPEVLVFKMAVVLKNSNEQEYNSLLGAVQARYEQIKSQVNEQ